MRKRCYLRSVLALKQSPETNICPIIMKYGVITALSSKLGQMMQIFDFELPLGGY